MIETTNIYIKIRHKAGLSQKGLADICGVWPRAASTWENGQSKPSMQSIKQIYQYLESHAEIGITGKEFLENL